MSVSCVRAVDVDVLESLSQAVSIESGAFQTWLEGSVGIQSGGVVGIQEGGVDVNVNIPVDIVTNLDFGGIAVLGHNHY